MRIIHRISKLLLPQWLICLLWWLCLLSTRLSQLPQGLSLRHLYIPIEMMTLILH